MGRHRAVFFDLGGTLFSYRSINSHFDGVLELLARGHRNKEIADLLFISERTFKFHVGIIFQKLGVSNRAEAVSKALQSGRIKL